MTRRISAFAVQSVSTALLLASSLTAPPSLAAQQQTAAVEGVWGNTGAGNVYQIQGTILRQFEVTSETCVLGFVAEGRPSPVRDSEALFVTRGKASFSARAGISADHKILLSPNDSFGQVLTQLQRIPQLRGLYSYLRRAICRA